MRCWAQSCLPIDLVTWIESVRACQVSSMFAQSLLSPSVISDNVVFDGTIVVQPRQKLSRLPVAAVRFPLSVRPQHIRPVLFYLLTVVLTVAKCKRFFKSEHTVCTYQGNVLIKFNVKTFLFTCFLWIHFHALFIFIFLLQCRLHFLQVVNCE